MSYNTAEGNRHKDPAHVTCGRLKYSPFTPQMGASAHVAKIKKQFNSEINSKFELKRVKKIAHEKETEIRQLCRDFENLNSDLNTKTFCSQTHSKRVRSANREKARSKIGVIHQSSIGGVITQAIKDNLPEGAGVAPETIDKTMDIVESIVLMLGALSGTDEPSAMLCIVGQFLKNFTTGSIVSSVLHYVSDIVTSLSHQDSSTTGFEGFIDSLKGLRNSWQVTMCGPFAKQVSRFLGVLVAVGIYSAAELTFEVKGFKLLEPDVEVIACNAFDLVDCIFDVSIFFLERSFKTWKSGDLSTFVLDDDESANLDEEYIWVKKNWTFIQSGEERTGVTKSEFDKRAQKLGLRLRDAHRCATKGQLKAILGLRVEEIRTIINKSAYIDMTSTSRWWPTTFGFFGESGLGKSYMIEIFLRLICVAVGLPYGEGYLYVHKEGKKHFDSWKNHMIAVLLDDYMNKKEMGNDGGTNIVIDLVNRTPFRPPMASLEDKENADCHPDFVLFTGHDKTLRAYEQSISCISIQKRCEFAIDVRAKEEFIKYVDGTPAGIDSDKVREFYTNADGTEIPRLIDSTLWYTITTVKPGKDHTKVAPYAICTYNGKLMKDVEAEEVLAFLIDATVRNRKREAELAKRNSAPPIDLFPRCSSEGCCHFAHSCPYHGKNGTPKAVFGTGPPDDKTLPPPLPPKSDPKPRRRPSPRKHQDGEATVDLVYRDLDEDAEYMGVQNQRVIDEIATDIIEQYERDWLEQHAETYFDDQSDVTLPKIVEDSDEESDGNDDLSEEQMEEQSFGFVFSSAMAGLRKRIAADVSRKIFLGVSATQMATYHGLSNLWTKFDWLKFVPRGLVKDPWFAEATGLIDADRLYSSFVRRTLAIMSPFGLTCASYAFTKAVKLANGAPLYSPSRLLASRYGKAPGDGILHLIAGSSFLMAGLLATRGNWEAVKKRHLDDLLARNDVTRFCNTATRDKFMLTAMAYTSAAAGLYAALKIMRQLKHLQKVGFEGWIDSLLGISKEVPLGVIGDVVPKLTTDVMAPASGGNPDVGVPPEEEEKKDTLLEGKHEDAPITHKDAKPQPDLFVETIEKNTRNGAPSDWLTPNFSKISLDPRAKTSTSSQVKNVVGGNLYHFDNFDSNTGKPVSFGNVTFVDPSLCYIQKHYVSKMKKFKMRLKVNDDPRSTNHSRSFDVYEDNLFEIPESDYVFIYSYAAGILCKDITHLYPQEKLTVGSNHSFTMIYRDDSGAIKTSDGTGRVVNFSVAGGQPFLAIEYTQFQGITFPGLCGASLIRAGNSSCILGSHVAGCPGKDVGVAAAMDVTMINRARAHFMMKGRHMYSEVPPPNLELMGKRLEEQEGLHPKHFMNFQTQSSHWTMVGAVKPAGAQRSCFKIFDINDTVKKVFKDEVDWGPPKMSPIWWGYQKWYEKAREPMGNIDPVLVDKAIDDYMSSIAGVVHHPDWKDKLKPLSDDEALNGIPGRRFISGWPIGTAAGLPLEGDKKQLIDIHPETGERSLKKEFVEELEKDRSKLRAGTRTCHPVKTFFKDEPHPSTKEKVRVVNVVSPTTNFEVRRLWLPIIEMIELNPTAFEIAVGVNASNHEWDDIMTHVKRFGSGRVFAGDYSGYDTKLSQQMLQAAFKVLYNIAATSSGYTEEDLAEMRTLMEELTAPFIVIDGAIFIPSLGFWISGNALTVIINAIANSLIIRCFFFSIYPDRKFNENVALITYGDDCIGEISSLAPLMTCTGFAEWLGRHGLKFTRFDKSDEPMPDYYTWQEADFLKRKSVFHPDIGIELGALEPESMRRMMRVCTLKKGNGLSAYDISCMNVSGAVREAFLHGRDFYEDFREKCISVVLSHNMAGHVEGLDMTYDDRIQDWIQRNGERCRDYLVRKNREIPRALSEMVTVTETKKRGSSYGLPVTCAEWRSELGFDGQDPCEDIL